MYLRYHKTFRKQYKKLPPKLQARFVERSKIFELDPFAPELHNHALHGEYTGHRSINITADIRAVYRVLEGGIEFMLIDTHSNLY